MIDSQEQGSGDEAQMAQTIQEQRRTIASLQRLLDLAVASKTVPDEEYAAMMEDRLAELEAKCERLEGENVRLTTNQSRYDRLLDHEDQLAIVGVMDDNEVLLALVEALRARLRDAHEATTRVDSTLVSAHQLAETVHGMWLAVQAASISVHGPGLIRNTAKQQAYHDVLIHLGYRIEHGQLVKIGGGR